MANAAALQRPATERGQPIVAVDNLVKRYKDTTAVNGVSFTVEPGETFGLLGPNGAGKTTTLAIVSGLLRADSGDVHVGGHSVSRTTRSAQRLLGVVPQSLALYEDLTARQNLNYFARLRGLRGSDLHTQVATAIAFVELEDAANRKAGTFSGGMKRRLNIAIGLLGAPRVLLLDEPTVGVDPQSRRHILDAVRRLADTGVTVLYTSHYMEEVEYLCERLAIMDHGRVIAQGPIDEIRALAGDSVVLRLPLPADLAHDNSGGGGVNFDTLQAAAGVPMERHSHELRFVLPEGSGQAPALLTILQQHGLPLDGMRLETPNLETVFLSLTGQALRDGTAVADSAEKGS